MSCIYFVKPVNEVLAKLVKHYRWISSTIKSTQCRLQVQTRVSCSPFLVSALHTSDNKCYRVQRDRIANDFLKSQRALWSCNECRNYIAAPQINSHLPDSGVCSVAPKSSAQIHWTLRQITNIAHCSANVTRGGYVRQTSVSAVEAHKKTTFYNCVPLDRPENGYLPFTHSMFAPCSSHQSSDDQ